MPAKVTNLLSTSVYETLRRGILTGRYGRQERISDVAIAEDLDVSRTPVREAIQRLEHDGLVSRDGRRRLTVTSITDEDIASIYPIVAALEGLAARLAVPRRTAADLSRLRGLNVRMARSRGQAMARRFSR